ARAPATPAKHLRILVVEDNKGNQMVAIMMLKKLGYIADIASNGQEALDVMDRLHYDLVFMDCQMPEMDGYQASQEIRRREAGQRHTPIIAMTANAMEGDRDHCLAAGMDDYIAKPIQPGILQEKVEQWGAGNPARAAASAFDAGPYEPAAAAS